MNLAEFKPVAHCPVAPAAARSLPLATESVSPPLLADVPNKPSEGELANAVTEHVAPQTPAEFDSFIKSEIVRWGEACRAAGIEPQ